MDARLLELYARRWMEERIQAATEAQRAQQYIAWRHIRQGIRRVLHRGVRNGLPMSAVIREASGAVRGSGK